MKTFDIAIDYVKSISDLKTYNLNVLARSNEQSLTQQQAIQLQKIHQTAQLFLNDNRLTHLPGNNYSWGITLEVALKHSWELLTGTGPTQHISYFMECCCIIEDMTKGPINALLNLKKYRNTIYPNRIVKEFEKLCEASSGSPKPVWAQKHEGVFDIFCVAWHYVKNK